MSANRGGLEGSSGFCLTVFYLVPARQVRNLIPPSLKIIEVLPGFTVGGIYAARHRKDKDNALSEFGILPAYVRQDEKTGYFMHHYCVDNHATVSSRTQGADETHASEFEWEITDKKLGFSIYSGGVKMISVRLRPVLKNLPFSACIPLICVKGSNVVFMRNQFASNIGLSTSSVNIPKGSPLKGFPFRFKLISTYWEASNIVKKEHEFVKERVMGRADEAFGSSMGSGACKGRCSVIRT